MTTKTNLTLEWFMEIFKPMISDLKTDIWEIKIDVKELKGELTRHMIDEIEKFATKDEHKENKTSIQTQNEKIVELEKNWVKINYFHSAIVVVVSAFVSWFWLVILEKILNNK